MVRGSVARRLVSVLGSWLILAVAAPEAQAFEYLEGKIQVHGYFEETVRAISTDFNQSLDLTQWYHTLHIEMDIDIAKDGWGPFDSVGAYIGAEVRYDCVWTRACGFSPSVNVYGNRSEQLPSRLSNAKDPRIAGTTNYQQPIYRQPDRRIGTHWVYPPNTNPPTITDATPLVPVGPRLAERTIHYRGADQTSPFSALLATRQPLASFPATIPATFQEYIPGRYTFEPFLNYGFALRNVRSGNNGMGTQAMPWDPKDEIDPQGTLASRVNPFRDVEVNPITGIPGDSSIPFRPGPNFNALAAPNAWTANGLFVPSLPYANYLRQGGSDKFDQNFSQEELAWNRGASQQQTKELKEAYLELEMLGGSLFLRLGRQTIVWGKTELFATTDLFNPNDLALGSLTSLEESRIPLWAMRAIYSFYEVGPLEDVRLEVALDLDDFTPSDLGRCGEPYTPNPVCDKTFGLIVHGITALAIAGENRPPHWWDSSEGLQGGARLEFRWDRYSFALVDFWNYTKFPYTDRLSTYARNVDPATGRPRRYGATGPCTDGNQPACLQGGNDALLNSPVNLQLYSVICSSSVAFNALDRRACAQSVLTSQTALPPPNGALTVTNALSMALAGSALGIELSANDALVGGNTLTNGRAPFVSLSIDRPDTTGVGTDGFSSASPPLSPLANNLAINYALPGFPVIINGNHNPFQSLDRVLSPQQQALLGCGPFYGTNCDGGVDPGGAPAPGGMDLLNSEASALMQSWIGFEGSPLEGMLTTDASRPQPGTVGFVGGPLCTRVNPDGSTTILPGCRRPGDPGYNVNEDGGDPAVVGIGYPVNDPLAFVPPPGPTRGPVISSQGQPFTGQPWQSEMAALSWNLQALLVAFSTTVSAGTAVGDPGSDPALRFDAGNAYRTNGCSYVVPWMCSSVRALWSVTGVRRQSVNAGGNSRFGRRDMVWAQGGEVALAYEKRNVLGFSMDFAEDVSKTNWGTEFTWVRNNPFSDQNKFGGVNKTDAFNLTISVDRPTFINFLNQSRTVFFNSQWFFGYVPGYHNSFTTNGPWNAFFTFTAQTGYFQDRLLPGMTWVYDVQSESGAALPSITYRFTESFSATFGFALFWGRYEGKDLPLNPLTPSDQAGAWAYRSWVENGLAVVRDRDEVYMRIRYTF